MSKIAKQQLIFLKSDPVFPSTRFQGSKLKIVDWIWDGIKELKFHSALDAFGGTGCIAYMLKNKGKQVTYNDILKFNWYVGIALIENDFATLNNEDVDFLINKHRDIKYSSFVSNTFKGIYFTNEENKWIDIVVTNIDYLDNLYKKLLPILFFSSHALSRGLLTFFIEKIFT